MSYESHELRLGHEVELELLDAEDKELGRAEIIIIQEDGGYWLNVRVPMPRQLGEPYGSVREAWIPLRGAK